MKKYWICCGLETLLCLIIVFLFDEYLTITVVSSLPALAFATQVGLAVFYSPENEAYWDSLYRHTKFYKNEYTRATDTTHSYDYGSDDAPELLRWKGLMLLAAPLALPGFFFFSNVIKGVLAATVFFAPYIILFLLALPALRASIKKENALKAARERELEKQERLEEEMDWNDYRK